MNNTTQEPELPSKEHLFEESCLIIDEAQHEAYHAVNIALLKRNWLLGKRLNETINSGQDRAEYGKTIVRTLSQQLVVKYGNAFGERNLYHYMSFHRLYNDLFTLPESYFQDNLNAMRSNNLYVVGMLNSMRSKFPIRISWTHFRILLQVEDGEARDWYAKESSENSWSTRTLQRNNLRSGIYIKDVKWVSSLEAIYLFNSWKYSLPIVKHKQWNRNVYV